MIRNASDHGIDNPPNAKSAVIPDRHNHGRAARESRNIVIEVMDDGAGLINKKS